MLCNVLSVKTNSEFFTILLSLLYLSELRECAKAFELYYDSVLYHITEEKILTNYQEAIKKCEEHKSILAVINTLEIKEFIVKELMNKKSK